MALNAEGRALYRRVQRELRERGGGRRRSGRSLRPMRAPPGIATIVPRVISRANTR